MSMTGWSSEAHNDTKVLRSWSKPIYSNSKLNFFCFQYSLELSHYLPLTIKTLKVVYSKYQRPTKCSIELQIKAKVFVRTLRRKRLHLSWGALLSTSVLTTRNEHFKCSRDEARPAWREWRRRSCHDAMKFYKLKTCRNIFKLLLKNLSFFKNFLKISSLNSSNLLHCFF